MQRAAQSPRREFAIGTLGFRGEGLGDDVCDTEPLSTGLHTLEPKAGNADSEETARVAGELAVRGVA